MMLSTRSKEDLVSNKVMSECCMCGDYGLSEELFQCDVCSFRSQHRYCSNLYSKAESYRVCNWCLSKTDHPMIDSTDPKSTQNSSTSSLSSHRNDAEEDEENIKSINKKSSRTKRHDHQEMVHKINIPNLKKESKTPSPPSVARKRIITRGALEERLRKTKSEDMLNNNNNTKNNKKINHSNNINGIITKQVFRNKVRRYKLLDEVSN